MQLLILLAALASAPTLGAAGPQDPVQMSRIASDQRLVAEQVRRLTRLLGQLEARDRAEDRLERADLLASAAQRLAGVSSGKDLAAAMEGIAGDLAALRTGSAVDGQTSTLQTLEEILQLLLQSQSQLQEEQRAAELQEQLAVLQQLLSRQEELRKRDEDLLRQACEAADAAAAAGKSEPDPSEQRGEPSAAERARSEELAQLAREQAALAEQIAALGKSGRQEAAERASEHAAQAAERLERAAGGPPQESAPAGEPQPQEAQPKDGSQPQEAPPKDGSQPQEAQPKDGSQPQEAPPKGAESAPSEAARPGDQGGQKPTGGQASPPADPQDGERQQERAIEEQQNAEEALQEAIEQAEEELERIEQRQQLQDLEDVRMLAEQILAQHRVEEAAIQELLAAGATTPTRAQRARLRQVARSEEDLAAATQSLLIKIETLGASTFPFFLGTIQKDHERLARELGPPRLQLEEHAATLAADISSNWEMLLDVIRTEAERLSNEMEQQPQDGQPQEPEEQPLVDFAQELQLLKRLQEGLGRDLVWLRRKFDTYGAAGIAPGPDEEQALSILLDRQIELRRQFEDMLSRLQAQREESIPAKDL